MLKQMIHIQTTSYDGLRSVLILSPHPYLCSMFEESERIFAVSIIQTMHLAAAEQCDDKYRVPSKAGTWQFSHFAWGTFHHAKGEGRGGRTGEGSSQLRLNPCKVSTAHALHIAKDTSRNWNLDSLSAVVNISVWWLNVYAILLKVWMLPFWDFFDLPRKILRCVRNGLD